MSNSFVTSWTVAHQAPLFMGFSRQGYWSRLPFLSPGYLPDPVTEPECPALADRFFTTEPLGKSTYNHMLRLYESLIYTVLYGWFLWLHLGFPRSLRLNAYQMTGSSDLSWAFL